MAKSIQRLEAHFLPPGKSVPATSPKGVIKFSVNVKGIDLKHESIAVATTKFFTQKYAAGFALDKERESWNALGKDHRKSLSNKFTAIKCAVRMVLMHADSFPTSPDKNSIERIAKAAEERIRNDFEFKKNETITVCKIQKHEKTKELQPILELPANTPEDVKKFFNSD